MNVNFVAIGISFLVSAVLCGVVWRWAKVRHVAYPIRERDVHRRAVPRIGGIAIFAAFLIVVLLYQLTDPTHFSSLGFPFAIFGFSIDKRLLALLVGAFVLVVGMFFDDIKGMRPYQKLGIQIGVALIVIAGGIGITYINNPFGGPPLLLDHWQIPVSLGGVVYHFVVIADTLAILWLVSLMNILNFSDGIDGLAGSLSVVALGVLMILSMRNPVMQPATALIAAIAIGSVLGFLVWNLPPARLFMGDTGSMFLGFLIGVLGIIAGAKLATTVVVLAVPIIDAAWVIGIRFFNRQNPLTHPDRNHLHHRFLQAGFSVAQTLGILVSISILFGLAALQDSGIAKVRSFVVALGVVFLVMLAVHMLQRKEGQST